MLKAMLKMFRALSDRKMAIMLAMGFSSGLPLLLTGSLLQAWCKQAGLDLTTIGFILLTGLPYTLKFVWAPFMDRYVPPVLGRRRGWIMISQSLLVLSLLGLACSHPSQNIYIVAFFAMAVAFVSASQDIGLDAYRREYLPASVFGLGNSIFITGYRLGMYLAGPGAMIIVGLTGKYPIAYFSMAGAACFGLIVTFFVPEPVLNDAPPTSIREAYVQPFLDFFSKKDALWLLAFILLYKVGDNMATAMTTPFYMDLGFSILSIGAIGKTFGIIATIVGGIVGGAAMFYLGMRKSLWIFGVFQGLANMSFFWLAVVAPGMNPNLKLTALACAITVENLTAGMGTSAYTAFMASLTNKRYTATQYALLSSLMGVPRVILGAPTGWVAQHTGWEEFFVICTLCSIPGLLILLKVGKWAIDELDIPDQNMRQNQNS